MFVVPGGRVIGAVRPMSVVSHITFSYRRATWVCVPRVRVWTLS
jgi:hypothetical protein